MRTPDMTSRRDIAERFARHLKEKYGPRIDRILLFGSVARGEDREDSDIDLLVVTPEPTLDLQWDIGRDVTGPLARAGLLVSALVAPAKRGGEGRDTRFARRVRSEGLALA